jgi:hypothetical protein
MQSAARFSNSICGAALTTIAFGGIGPRSFGVDIRTHRNRCLNLWNLPDGLQDDTVYVLRAIHDCSQGSIDQRFAVEPLPRKGYLSRALCRREKGQRSETPAASVQAGSSGEDYNLTASVVLLHQAMGLYNFVQMENLAYLNVQRAGLDLHGEVIEGRPHKVLRLAGVGRQANPGRDNVHRRELIEGPLVSDNACHAHNAALF